MLRTAELRDWNFMAHSIRNSRESLKGPLGTPIGYGEKWLDATTDTYTNTAKAALDAFTALIADARAGRQIRG